MGVDKYHYALACMGMVLCGTCQRIRAAGTERTLALLPVLLAVTVHHYEELRELTKWSGSVRHIGGATMAAHAAVEIAERVRKRAAAQGGS